MRVVSARYVNIAQYASCKNALPPQGPNFPILVHIRLRPRGGPDGRPGRVSQMHALAPPFVLHFLALLPFRLAVLDAQLLKEDVTRVEDGRLGAAVGAATVQEGRQLMRRCFEGRSRSESAVDVADEAGIARAGCVAHVSADLGADVVARVVYGDIVGVFAVEVDSAHVVASLCFGLGLRGVGVAGVGRGGAGRLDFLLGHADPGEFPALEEHGRSQERAAFGAPVRSVLAHEVRVAAGGDSEGALELADFHLPAVDVLADFGPDLVGGPRLDWE